MQTTPQYAQGRGQAGACLTAPVTLRGRLDHGSAHGWKHGSMKEVSGVASRPQDGQGSDRCGQDSSSGEKLNSESQELQGRADPSQGCRGSQICAPFSRVERQGQMNHGLNCHPGHLCPFVQGSDPHEGLRCGRIGGDRREGDPRMEERGCGLSENSGSFHGRCIFQMNNLYLIC